MEENEVFDSSLLKESVNSLIASGKRNFALDMSPLDYVYSDTINMLLALNKRVLDVTGRLSLMAPQPEVMQILKRAGINNILRVFETETELIKSSEDMILQTSSLKSSDVNAALQQEQGPPPSEFDQLRNEIGSVFGSGEEPPVSAPPQAPHPKKPASEDDFDQMFHQFDTGSQANRGGFGAPPVQPQISSPQTPKFQPRQYSPTQPPQPVPVRPPSPAQPKQPSSDIPKFSPDYSSVRPETQRFSTAPGATVPPYQSQRPAEPVSQEPISFDDEGAFEPPSPKMKPEKKTRFRDDFDSFDEDEEFSKKSSFPVALVVILIVALLGAGGLVFFLVQSSQKEPAKVATTVPAKEEPPPTPQIPVETPQVSPDSAKDSDLEKEIVESKPEISKPAPVAKRSPPKPPIRKKTTVSSRKRKTSTSTRTRSKRRAATRPTKTNKVVIASSPSGASVSINGKKMGTTPFTWTKPFFGSVTVQLSKSGYETLKQSFEFTGGSVNKSYSLEKEAPPPVVKKSPPKRRTRTASTSKPTKKAPPPPVDDFDEMDDPFADFDEEDDFALEPEPEPVASRPTTTPTRKTPTPSASSGGQALIFIASIPPVADVFIGDKLIGKTNVSELKIPAGVQTLKFVKGGKQISKQLNLKPGKNPSQMVRIP